MLAKLFNQSEDITKIMKKTIGFAAACSAMLLVGQVWAFGGGAGPRANNPGYGPGDYGQQPYAGYPGSGGGFGGGPGSANPGYGRGYGPGGPGGAGPGSGGGFGGGPRGQQPGPGYGGYQQGGPGGYNAYQQPPQGYAPPRGQGYQPAPEEYDIPRDAYGQQYHRGQGGYPQGPAPGYYGNPGYGYPPPGYPDDYYRERDNNNSGGFPNPMNMMKSPMNMFGGSKD